MEGRVYRPRDFGESEQAMGERIALHLPEREEIGESFDSQPVEMKVEHIPKIAETFSEQENEIPRLVDSQPRPVFNAIRNFASYLERARAELLNSEKRGPDSMKRSQTGRNQPERNVLERALVIAAAKLLLPLLKRLLPRLSGSHTANVFTIPKRRRREL
jgi:hypothetical protein